MKRISNIPMTKEYSDEINVLLKDHSHALTAFYDEGIRYGWHARKGYDIGYILGVGTVIGVVTGVAILIRKKKKKQKIKNQKSES